jgi:hypothetical protein
MSSDTVDYNTKAVKTRKIFQICERAKAIFNYRKT